MAAHVVYKSELTQYSKIQALRFIEEASERQLLVFMSEGKIRRVSEDENLKLELKEKLTIRMQEGGLH